MKKYIDADKLIAKLRKHLIPTVLDREYDEWEMGKDAGLQQAIGVVESLQQEQPKADLVAELKHHLATTPKEQLEKEWKELEHWNNVGPTVQEFLYGKKPEMDFINIDSHIQYANIEAGIKAHAETYSFNIESKLFPRLTKEQQALWRKEIEQACISGGEAGLELVKDIRYKENQQPEVDLEKEYKEWWENKVSGNMNIQHTAEWYMHETARHFYSLGFNARKEE